MCCLSSEKLPDMNLRMCLQALGKRRGDCGGGIYTARHRGRFCVFVAGLWDRQGCAVARARPDRV